MADDQYYAYPEWGGRIPVAPADAWMVDYIRSRVPGLFKDDPTLGGALLEGAFNVPRGALSAGLLGARGIAALLPGEGDDALVRRALDAVGGTYDARYADSFIANTGAGIGSLGPLVGLSLVPGAGPFLAGGLGVAMGMGEQAQRMDEVIEQGGRVSDAERRAALTGGALIGATEVLPVAKLLNTFKRAARTARGAQVAIRSAEQMGAAAQRGVIRSAAQQFLAEGTQEFGAAFGQNALAGFLYDPNAEVLPDFQEFTVGGTVGALYDVVGTMAARRAGRRKAAADSYYEYLARLDRHRAAGQNRLREVQERRQAAEAQGVTFDPRVAFGKTYAVQQTAPGVYTIVDSDGNVVEEGANAEDLQDRAQELTTEQTQLRAAAEAITIAEERGVAHIPSAVENIFLTLLPESRQVDLGVVARLLRGETITDEEIADPQAEGNVAARGREVKVKKGDQQLQALKELIDAGRVSVSLSEAAAILGGLDSPSYARLVQGMAAMRVQTRRNLIAELIRSARGAKGRPASESEQLLEEWLQEFADNTAWEDGEMPDLRGEMSSEEGKAVLLEALRQGGWDGEASVWFEGGERPSVLRWASTLLGRPLRSYSDITVQEYQYLASIASTMEPGVIGNPVPLPDTQPLNYTDAEKIPVQGLVQSELTTTPMAYTHLLRRLMTAHGVSSATAVDIIDNMLNRGEVALGKDGKLEWVPEDKRKTPEVMTPDTQRALNLARLIAANAGVDQPTAAHEMLAQAIIGRSGAYQAALLGQASDAAEGTGLAVNEAAVSAEAEVAEVGMAADAGRVERLTETLANRLAKILNLSPDQREALRVKLAEDGADFLRIAADARLRGVDDATARGVLGRAKDADGTTDLTSPFTLVLNIGSHFAGDADIENWQDLTDEQILERLDGTVFYEAVRLLFAGDYITQPEKDAIARAADLMTIPGTKKTYLRRAQELVLQSGLQETDPGFRERSIEQAAALIAADMREGKLAPEAPTEAKGWFAKFRNILKAIVGSTKDADIRAALNVIGGFTGTIDAPNVAERGAGFSRLEPNPRAEVRSTRLTDLGLGVRPRKPQATPDIGDDEEVDRLVEDRWAMEDDEGQAPPPPAPPAPPPPPTAPPAAPATPVADAAQAAPVETIAPIPAVEEAVEQAELELTEEPPEVVVPQKPKKKKAKNDEELARLNRATEEIADEVAAKDKRTRAYVGSLVVAQDELNQALDAREELQNQMQMEEDLSETSVASGRASIRQAARAVRLARGRAKRARRRIEQAVEDRVAAVEQMLINRGVPEDQAFATAVETTQELFAAEGSPGADAIVADRIGVIEDRRNGIDRSIDTLEDMDDARTVESVRMSAPTAEEAAALGATFDEGDLVVPENAADMDEETRQVLEDLRTVDAGLQYDTDAAEFLQEKLARLWAAYNGRRNPENMQSTVERLALDVAQQLYSQNAKQLGTHYLTPDELQLLMVDVAQKLVDMPPNVTPRQRDQLIRQIYSGWSARKLAELRGKRILERQISERLARKKAADQSFVPKVQLDVPMNSTFTVIDDAGNEEVSRVRKMGGTSNARGSTTSTVFLTPIDAHRLRLVESSPDYTLVLANDGLVAVARIGKDGTPEVIQRTLGYAEKIPMEGMIPLELHRVKDDPTAVEYKFLRPIMAVSPAVQNVLDARGKEQTTQRRERFQKQVRQVELQEAQRITTEQWRAEQEQARLDEEAGDRAYVAALEEDIARRQALAELSGVRAQERAARIGRLTSPVVEEVETTSDVVDEALDLAALKEAERIRPEDITVTLTPLGTSKTAWAFNRNGRRFRVARTPGKPGFRVWEESSGDRPWQVKSLKEAQELIAVWAADAEAREARQRTSRALRQQAERDAREAIPMEDAVPGEMDTTQKGWVPQRQREESVIREFDTENAQGREVLTTVSGHQLVIQPSKRNRDRAMVYFRSKDSGIDVPKYQMVTTGDTAVLIPVNEQTGRPLPSQASQPAAATDVTDWLGEQLQLEYGAQPRPKTRGKTFKVEGNNVLKVAPTIQTQFEVTSRGGSTLVVSAPDSDTETGITSRLVNAGPLGRLDVAYIPESKQYRIIDTRNGEPKRRGNTVAGYNTLADALATIANAVDDTVRGDAPQYRRGDRADMREATEQVAATRRLNELWQGLKKAGAINPDEQSVWDDLSPDERQIFYQQKVRRGRMTQAEAQRWTDLRDALNEEAAAHGVVPLFGRNASPLAVRAYYDTPTDADAPQYRRGPAKTPTVSPDEVTVNGEQVKLLVDYEGGPPRKGIYRLFDAIKRLGMYDAFRGDDAYKAFQEMGQFIRSQYFDARFAVEKLDDELRALLGGEDNIQMLADMEAAAILRRADTGTQLLAEVLNGGHLSYVAPVRGPDGQHRKAESLKSGHFVVERRKLVTKSGVEFDSILDILNLMNSPEAKQIAHAEEVAHTYLINMRIVEIYDRARKAKRLHLTDEEANTLKGLLTALERKRQQMQAAAFTPGDQTEMDALNMIRAMDTGQNTQWMRTLAEGLIAWNDSQLDLMLDTGIITPDIHEEAYGKLYVPFRRMYKTDLISAETPGTVDQTRAQRKSLIETPLSGSTELISEPLHESILRNADTVLHDAMINVGYARVGEALLRLGYGREIVRGEGDPAYKLKAGEMRVRWMDGGAERVVVINVRDYPDAPELIQAMQFIGADRAEGFIKLMNGAADLLRQTVTRMPTFTLRNLFRDIGQAYVTTGAMPNPFKKGGSVRNFVDFMRDPNDPRWEKAKALGISLEVASINDRDRYRPQIERILNRKLGVTHQNGFANTVVQAWDWLGDMSRKSDAATRMAIYERVLAETGNEAEAVKQALEVINYGRRGNNPHWRNVVPMVAFLNARMQGMDVLYRSAKGAYSALPEESRKANRQKFMTRAGIVMGSTLAYYLMVRDEDWYENLRTEVRNDYWVMPIAPGVLGRVPIPFEVGLMFKSIPEMILRAMDREDYGHEELGRDTFRQLSKNLMFNPIPQLFAPALDAWRNFNSFTASDIEPSYMEEGAPYQERRTANTSSTAQILSAIASTMPMVNISPLKMEYLIGGYFGTVGQYALNLSDMLVRNEPVRGAFNALPFVDDVPEPLAVGPGGTRFDYTDPTNLPLVSDFVMRRSETGGLQQEFYELRAEITRATTAINKAKEEGRLGDLQAYRHEYEALMNTKYTVLRLNRYMDRWRKRRDQILRDEGLSNRAKTEMVRMLEEERDEQLAVVPLLKAAINRERKAG